MTQRDSDHILDSAKADLIRGEEACHNRRLEEAINLFTRTIQMTADAGKGSRLESILVEAYICRGVAWGRTGDTDNALEDFSQAITINPSRGLAYYNRAVAWHHIGELSNAIEDYSQAIEMDPTNADAYLGRGKIWKTQNERHKASTDFAKVKELKSGLRGLQRSRRRLAKRG